MVSTGDRIRTRPGAGRRRFASVSAVLSLALTAASVWSSGRTDAGAAAQARPAPGTLFQTADNCMACHNGLQTSSGEDVSFGTAWRASMMANSARDPYWQASVRRETIDHPQAASHIEDECSVCHMPMARTVAAAGGGSGQVFAHLPLATGMTPEAALAADGVSCTLCHQITQDRLGSPESFTGGFVIDTSMNAPPEQRPVFGPYPIQPGRMRVMHSATGFLPVESLHVRNSGLCATCHTLFTTPRGPNGEALGPLFPEQVPYLEWQHSAYRDERSCQSCHMPIIEGEVRVSSVLGEPRTGAARHDFRGGNFFMLRMLNRYRDELAVQALPHELEAAARLALQHLQSEAARLAVRAGAIDNGMLPIDVEVQNLTGHKLPTAYPSRRVWIHLTVRDRNGRPVFESGAVASSGAIRGNDNDRDRSAFEPHHTRITSEDQVQIYESVMADTAGRVTTGLISAVRYLKDNRLLPHGFDKRTAGSDIAVVGGAAGDPDFEAPADRVSYGVNVGNAAGPFRIEAELRYQPIGFRWADNLRTYEAEEPRRFVKYFDSMSAASSEVLARTEITAPVR
jgi:hypothetical protein